MGAIRPIGARGDDGASLPTATAAGELLRSTGAGDDYEAVDQADVLGDSLAAVLGGEPAGATIISDGAGDVAVTSAAVSALLAAADASGVLATLDAARTTTYAFADATGVTLVQGNGTAAVTGGQVVMTTASGADTTTPNAPTATVAIPATVDPWRGVDVSVQLVGATGTVGGNANRSWLSLSNMADSKNATPTTGDAIVYCFGGADGALGIADAGGGAGTVRTTTATGVLLLDGQDWWRIIVRGTTYSVYTGRGASRPTTWTHRYTGLIGGAATLVTPLAQVANVTLSGYRNGSQLQAHVVTFDNLLITGLL